MLICSTKFIISFNSMSYDHVQLITKILHNGSESGSVVYVTSTWHYVMSTSCEPPQTSTYSEDLLWRMVWQSELLGYSQQTIIAQNLGVDQSTVIVHVTKITCTSSVKQDLCHQLYPWLYRYCFWVHLFLPQFLHYFIELGQHQKANLSVFGCVKLTTRAF